MLVGRRIFWFSLTFINLNFWSSCRAGDFFAGAIVLVCLSFFPSFFLSCTRSNTRWRCVCICLFILSWSMFYMYVVCRMLDDGMSDVIISAWRKDVNVSYFFLFSDTRLEFSMTGWKWVPKKKKKITKNVTYASYIRNRIVELCSFNLAINGRFNNLLFGFACSIY